MVFIDDNIAYLFLFNTINHYKNQFIDLDIRTRFSRLGFRLGKPGYIINEYKHVKCVNSIIITQVYY